MNDRRSSKGPKEVREEASAQTRRDPRRDSYQMSMPALVAELTRELATLKKRVAQLEQEKERERNARVRAEEALKRAGVRGEDDARATRQLRAASAADAGGATRKSTMPPENGRKSSAPRASVPPDAKDTSTKRLPAVRRHSSS